MVTVVDFSADWVKKKVACWHCNTGGRDVCGAGVRYKVTVTRIRETWYRQDDHAGILTGTRHDTTRP